MTPNALLQCTTIPVPPGQSNLIGFTLALSNQALGLFSIDSGASPVLSFYNPLPPGVGWTATIATDIKNPQSSLHFWVDRAGFAGLILLTCQIFVGNQAGVGVDLSLSATQNGAPAPIVLSAPPSTPVPIITGLTNYVWNTVQIGM